MPKDRLTARGRAARERILLAAEPVFAARGFHGANVRELAAAAKTPTASLLHHFPTKEKLYAAVLGSIAAELEVVFDGVLDDEDAPYAERLESVVATYLEWTARAPGRSNLLLRELLDNPSRVEAPGAHLILAPLVDRLQRFVRAGQRDGAFRKLAPIAFITHVVGGGAYLCAARPTFERLVPERQRANLARRSRRDLAPLICEPLLAKEPAP